MKIINIKNSKLRLVIQTRSELVYGSTNTAVLRNKKHLRYQSVVYNYSTDPDKFVDPKLISTCGLKSIIIPEEVSTVMFLEKINDRNPSDIKLDTDECNYVLRMIFGFCSDYPEVTEALALATDSKEVVLNYYSTYGDVGFLQFRSYLRHKIKWMDFEPQDKFETTYKYNEKCHRYSVVSLVEDLIKDEAGIIVSDDLYKYHRISGKTSHRVELKSLDSLQAYNITGIQRNKGRANLSLSYKVPVKVSIPSSPYTTEKELNLVMNKNFCLIKDGVKNGKYLGVKISNKLAGKFKKLGIIDTPLVYSGEYLLDLEKLPAATRSKTRQVSAMYLAKKEIQSLVLSIKLKYLEYYLNILSPISQEEKYLRTLGIYGKKTYSLNFDKTGLSSGYYTVRALSASSYPNIKFSKNSVFALVNKYRTKKTTGDQIMDGIFSSIQSELDEIGTDKISILQKKLIEEKKKIDTDISERKFRFIMSKKCIFSDLKRGKKQSVPIYLEGQLVNVNWTFSTEKIYYYDK